jgi:hypothetical protein
MDIIFLFPCEVVCNKRLQFSDVIQPIALANDANKDYVGEVAVTSGFGYTFDGKKF